jgi:selenocysteine lyase/cysteine desulfurase
MDPFLPDDQKVAAIRELLPATGAGIFLDVLTAGPLPAETDRALREADDWELRVGRGGPDHAADADLRREEASGVLAAVLGVTPDRVLPVMGLRAATAAVLAVLDGPARAVGLAPGLDPAVATTARALATARGWTVTDVADVPGGIVLAPAVRATDGAPVDLVGLAARAHAGGGLLVADLSLAAGAMDVSLPATGADAAVLATDRWLLGPDGTACAWWSPALGPAAIAAARDMSDPMPRRAALGLGRSVGWLLMYVGLPWAVSRTTMLATRLRRGLAGVEGVELRGSQDEASPVVVLTIGGWSVDEAATELGSRVFAITGRTPDGAALRLGVGAWNTEDELDRFTSAVAELAAHTPATLPRRQPLAVLGGG